MLSHLVGGFVFRFACGFSPLVKQIRLVGVPKRPAAVNTIHHDGTREKQAR